MSQLHFTRVCFIYNVVFFLRTPRPVIVEPMEQFDDEDGLPEKLMQKTQQYHKYVLYIHIIEY